jgi:cell division protein FtsQ
MSSNYESARFFRPPDVARLRRNQRRIQAQRIFVMAFNALIVAAIVIGSMWLWQRTQSDARFAVRTIEIAGAVHTPRPALDAITRHYVGANLFRIDIARVQRDLGGLAWVRRIDIEKKLPGTLRISVVERTPVALVTHDSRVDYVDGEGVDFAELAPAVGDSDLPLIEGARGRELARSVAFLAALRANDKEVYSRISEVQPIAPNGFAIFDRDLATIVYVNAGDVSKKVRSLYAVARAEQLGRGAIDYADLRFNDRIVIKPVKPMNTPAVAPQTLAPAQITN